MMQMRKYVWNLKHKGRICGVIDHEFSGIKNEAFIDELTAELKSDRIQGRKCVFGFGL